VEQPDSTSTIENAIAHLPDDGPDLSTSDSDLGGDELGGDETPAPAADAAASTEGDPAPLTDPAADPTPEGVVEAKPAKKNPKYVPWDRFDAQTKGKQEALKQAQELQAKHDALEKSLADYKERAEAFDVLESNPELAVEALLKDERFGKLLTRREAEAIVEAAQEGTTPPPAKTAAAAIEAPVFPEPDVQLSDGSLTYRPETLERHMRAVAAYERQMGQTELRAEIEALKTELSSRVEPFERQAVDERVSKETLAARGKEFEGLAADYGAEFVAEHKDAMREWLRDQWGNKDANGRPTTPVKNAKAGLREAERAVLLPALKKAAKKERDDALRAADDAKKRAVAEQNTRAAAAGERPSAAGATRGETPRTPEDIINAAIDRHGLAAA
jgi:hypothetical protein